MKQNNKNLGFTLVELMVFFIFISIILAASTPIITKRIKSIPLKVNHGKFICYRDGNGNYVQRTFNAAKEVGEAKIVDSCSFKPPKRAILYKIELIGSGAGGYTHFIHKDENDARTTYYCIPGGSYNVSCNSYVASGDGAQKYQDLTTEQIYKYFMNVPFQFVANSGSGGNGGTISELGYRLLITGDKANNYNYTYGEGLDSIDDDIASTYSKISDLLAEKSDCSDLAKKDDEGKITNQEEIDACKNEYDDKIEALKSAESYDTNVKISNERHKDISNAASAQAKLYTQLHSRCNGVANHLSCSYAALDTDIDALDAIWADIVTTSIAGTQHNTVNGNGFPGGRNMQIVFKGKINFVGEGGSLISSKDEAAVNNYLGNLLTTYYQTGSTSAIGGCGGWSKSSVKSGEKGKDVTTNGTYDGTESNKGKDAGFPEKRYGAIYLKRENACITTTKIPKGGKGGSLYKYSDRVEWSKGTRLKDWAGEDAEGPSSTNGGLVNAEVSGVLSESQRNTAPYIQIDTELNKRYHEVGKSGTPGSVLPPRYVAYLRDDCVFNIPQGGQPIDESYNSEMLASLEGSLDTTLVCNEGTLKLRAEGGKYQKVAYPKEYTLYKYTPAGGDLTSTVLPTTLDEETSIASLYKYRDVFTKYKLDSMGFNFGGGGQGSQIKDHCNSPHGSHSEGVKYDGKYVKGPFGETIASKRPCNELTDVEEIEAENGVGGAIIISW